MSNEVAWCPPITDQGLSWIDEPGPASDIVVSSRVRLARNIESYRFAARASDNDREVILRRVREAAEDLSTLGEGDLWEIQRLDHSDRALLVERHLVSTELIGLRRSSPQRGAGLLLARDRTTGLMVNEEDHLRLQSLRGGLQLEAAWCDVDQLDEEIGSRIPYAYHPDLGFLTRCPTNAGTGLRASVFIHLPALVVTRQIAKVLQGVKQLGMTYRGLYGEGSKIVGNFFQLSNETTLGKSEEALIDQIERFVKNIIGYEQQARAALLLEAPGVLEDKVWRAYGILRHARRLQYEEFMNLLSGVRLGASLKLLESPGVETLSRVMIHAQTAHLSRAAGRRLNETDASSFRARYVRATLKDARRPG